MLALSYRRWLLWQCNINFALKKNGKLRFRWPEIASEYFDKSNRTREGLQVDAWRKYLLEEGFMKTNYFSMTISLVVNTTEENLVHSSDLISNIHKTRLWIKCRSKKWCNKAVYDDQFTNDNRHKSLKVHPFLRGEFN